MELMDGKVEKHLMETKYWKYDTYEIYTTTQKYIDADIKGDKSYALYGIMWAVAALFLVAAAIILGCNAGEDGYHLLSLSIIGSCCFGIALILCATGAIFYKKYEDYYKIYKEFWQTDEYKIAMKAIEKSEAKKKDQALKKKANDLITVYDTLDNKDMQKNEKIKIIKKYVKEDD